MKRLQHCRFIAALTAGTLTALVSGAAQAQPATGQPFRPPAVPLVTFDPYLSIWSEADHLNDDVTRHWTHREHPLVSLIRVDGQVSRLMGHDPVGAPAMPQVGLQVTPTRSIYEFQDAKVHVTLTFMTAALPHDLDVMMRPLSYLTWTVRSVDGATHNVSIYDSTSSLLTVNTPTTPVTWERSTMGNLTALRAGAQDQTLLQPPGDDVRINWGYAYAAAPTAQAASAIGGDDALVSSFMDHGALPATDDTRQPRPANDDQPVMAFVFNIGNVGAQPAQRHLMVAYDEIYAIKYFGESLRPYWRRNGATPADLLQTAERDYPSLTQRCVAFDQDLTADMTRVGGARYAQIAALAYRQCLAATGTAADDNKQPLLFTKENTSNGDIATVDVFFPMDPMMVFFSPALAKASLVPILAYAASSHWKFPNAPHDLGTYPVARGTDDGGEGMPVEESGNMLILCDAISQEEGSAKWVNTWWPKLTQWAQYLEKYGNDPEEQLCTDDFMGHLAHNANLSVKAIVGLAAYGDMCRMRGDKRDASRYETLAKGFALHWMQVANDGDHYRLAFDKPNTWSQKYNLVWDKLLNLNVFPPSVAKTEVNYYKSMLQPYGVPLDSRTKLTKTDWSVWSATLADNQADFETIVSPIYDFLNHTSARSPLMDSYVTNDIKSDGMHARPVVGGLFIKMLSDKATWDKWATGDKAKVGNWAALPVPPTMMAVVPTSVQQAVTWQYTTDQPGADWYKPAFDVTGWKAAPGPFGSPGTPGIAPKTEWRSDDIWLRRDFTMPIGNFSNLQVVAYHDEDIEVYFNGVLAAKEAGYVNQYTPLEISPAAKALLTPGAKITMTVHCHQTTGGQGVDVGLVNVVPAHR